MKYPMKHLLILFLFVFAAARLRADGVVDAKSFHKILILGDSITHHAPTPSLNWTGDWGMAATAADKDYVHLFLAKLADARGAGAPAPEVRSFAEGGGKITDKVPFVDKITAFHADLALVQLGENDNKDVTVEGFQQPYEKLLAAIRAGNPNARILCSGVWGMKWPGVDNPKDTMIRAACQNYGATFADLGASFADPANRAGAEHLFTSAGVNWHPSDAGMVAYADAFWKALSSPAPAPANPTPVSSAAASPPPAIPPPASSAAASPAPEATQAGIDETWGDPLSLKWSHVPPVAQEEGRSVAKISASGTDGAAYGAPLSVALFSGREVEIKTRVRADSVSDKPKRWNGVKLTLRLRNAEGKLDYPQYSLPTGTFPWTDVDWKVQIPDNTVEMDLIIGLESVSGTVWYDAIHISTLK